MGGGHLLGKLLGRRLVNDPELLIGQAFDDAVVNLLDKILVLEFFGSLALLAVGHQDPGVANAFAQDRQGIDIILDGLVVNLGGNGYRKTIVCF